jgi:hypothetical protein
VKNERDELLWASRQFQSELRSICHEGERALGERDEARQECVIGQKEWDTAMDQMGLLAYRGEPLAKA